MHIARLAADIPRYIQSGKRKAYRKVRLTGRKHRFDRTRYRLEFLAKEYLYLTQTGFGHFWRCKNVVD
jgi:hypothetical protein